MLPTRGYYYGHPAPFYYVYPNQLDRPKIVELEPSEIGGARSQLDARSDLTTYRHSSQFLPPQKVPSRQSDSGSGNGGKTGETDKASDQIITPTRRHGGGTRNYALDEVQDRKAAMNNGKSGSIQAKPRSWKQVNDDISARMIAASSDSPPVIPKRDYDHSPARSLPRPTRSVSSGECIGKDNGRLQNGQDSDWSAPEDYRRPSPYMDNNSPSAGQQLVLYNGPPPMPFPGPPHHDPNGFFPPPPGPFGPSFMPPHEIYGYAGVHPPPPPMFNPPPPIPEHGEGIYGQRMVPFMPPPHPGPFQGPPGPFPGSPGPFSGAPGPFPGPAMFPMDFEMFTWNQQKSKKKSKKGPKRSRSMDLLVPPPYPPPPPPHAWFMPPPIAPPPFMDENGAIYGAFPPRPPPPLALPPPPQMMNAFSAPPIPYSSSLKKDQSKGSVEEGKNGTKEKTCKHSTCYLMCCKGFTQVLWIIIGIILIGLVLGLVLGLTLV